MSRIVSERADKTDHVVILPASIEDPSKRPGLYRVGVLLACFSIFAFFAALVLAYILRAQSPKGWEPIVLPKILWWSTGLILASSVPLETGRRVFRRGEWRAASGLFLVTATMGTAFVACQVTAWRELVEQGAYLMENPHGAFFYLFTGLHAAHLLGGMAALFAILLGHGRRREIVDVVGYYWHFLGVLWVALFSVLKIFA